MRKTETILKKAYEEKINLRKRLDVLELQIMLVKSIQEKINNNDIRENHYIDRNFEDNQICYFAEVYYQVNNVSSNGMNRDISFFLSVDSQVVKLDFLMSKILDMKLSTNWRGGIKVKGGGMDMGFKVINDLQNNVIKTKTVNTVDMNALNQLLNKSNESNESKISAQSSEQKSNIVQPKETVGGSWSKTYKKSINCKKPRGFSQNQYCKAKEQKTKKKRKKRNTANKRKTRRN